MNTVLFKKGMILAIICLFIGASVVPNISSDESVSRGTIYVDDDADPGWYDATHVKTIQEGIDNATAGDIVFVYNGTYYENVVVNKTINLTGEDKNSTTINSSGSGDVVYISADLVNISEFSIRNSGSNWQDAGIDIISSNNTISGNTISNNNWGIWLYNSNNNVITDNTISNNSLIGVSLVGYDEGNVIVDNTIINNSCAGIKLENMSNYNLIAHNYIGYNGENSGCRGGILIFTGCGAQYNNTIRCNTLESNRNYGIYCMAGSPRNNSIYHNNFINNTQNAYDDGTNFWHNTTLQEGNYWSDFDEPSEGAWDNNSDGIVDTPYNISGGSNQDLYPFMNQNGWDNTSNLQPVADFTYSPMYPTTNDQVQFNDTSIDLDGEIDTWYWNFGDGNTSEEQNPTHQFLDNLTYNVTLTVIDDDGANDTITKQVITKSVYVISVPPYNETVIDDFLNETGTIITINVTNSTNISISSYSGNPTNENISSNITAVGNYIDIVVENDSYVIWPINLTIYYTQDDIDNAGVTEGELIGIFFYNESSLDWQLFNDTGVNATYNDDGYEGYCWANVWHLTNITLGGRLKLPDVYVDDDASPDWYDATHVKTIQEGIDNATTGDIVYVYSGTYYENLVVDETINLTGEDRNSTIIDGGGSGNVVSVLADYVNISRFTIQNSGSSSQIAGIQVYSDYNSIEGNFINSNCVGIRTFISSSNIIFGNIISSNNFSGIVSLYTTNSIISGNTISSSNNYGIFISRYDLYYSKNNTISGNTIFNNTYGIYLSFSNNSTISGNTISLSNNDGIHLAWNCTNNTIYNNYFNNTNNAYEYGYDYGTNIWNITKTLGTNIIGGIYLGGNYWSDYTGYDIDGDGLGDTNLPYNCSGYIQNGGDMLPLAETLDVNQSTHDRGFPIRHALDGDWAAAQSFIPTLDTLTRTEIYLRKFGTPEFNLTVELREDHPLGTLIDTLTFTPEEVPSSWEWFTLDFEDTAITPSTDYFIVCPPAPSGVTTSFGYEWGYAFGDQYDDGAFWFTRDGGGLWRDLPTMYEFVFRTYGYS